MKGAIRTNEMRIRNSTKPMENVNPEDENFWLNPIILNQVKTLRTSDRLALLPVFQYPTNLLKPVPAKILNFVSQLYL